MAIEQAPTIAEEIIRADSISARLTKSAFGIPFITAYAETMSAVSPMLASLADYIGKHDWKVIAQDVFTGPEQIREGIRSVDHAFSGLDWPVMWMQGCGYSGGFCYGTQLYVASESSVEPILLDGEIVGHVVEDHSARYCMLRNIGPTDSRSSRIEQARDTWQRMDRALLLAGMKFSDVVRTWFLLDDILSWYDDFNAVRTAFFREKGAFDQLMPASTGIGMPNPSGAALVSGAIAVRPKNSSVIVQAVPSPLQCSPADYGSSFSRAVQVEMAGCRALYVSGTASIEPSGATTHAGDLMKQIETTMEIVNAILTSRAMSWSNVTRCIAYFRNPLDVPAFGFYCKSSGLPPLPIMTAAADICRDDLLFEIEVDAVVGT